MRISSPSASAILAAKGSTVLGASATPVNLTGSVSVTTLATIVVPQGSLGLVRLFTLWSNNNSAGNKTGSARLGAGVTLFAITQTTSVSWYDHRHLFLGPAVNQQKVGAGTAAYGVGGINTGSLDMSAGPQNLLIQGQLAVGTDNIQLEGYLVELLPFV